MFVYMYIYNVFNAFYIRIGYIADADDRVPKNMLLGTVEGKTLARIEIEGVLINKIEELGVNCQRSTAMDGERCRQIVDQAKTRLSCCNTVLV